MKKFCGLALSSLFVSLLILVSCTSGSSSGSSSNSTKSLLLVDRYTEIGTPIDDEYTDTTKGYQYFIQPPFTEQLNGENVEFQYTFNTNGRTKDIYFIFTNISPSIASSYPVVSDPNPNISQSMIPETGGALKSNLINTNDAGLRGKPEISEFNRNPYTYLDKINPVKFLLNNIVLTPSGPNYDTAGDPTAKTFIIDSSTSLSAHCKYVSTPSVTTPFGQKILNIWVADNCWTSGGSKARLVDQTMVNALADKFLKSDNNDIYNWVSNIYGEEWGGSGWSTIPTNIKDNLIDPNDEITILLFDIDDDNSTSGGVLGYFWSKDNFKTTYSQYSNQRIMFYLDAVLLATNDGAWEITDRWPADIVSTLAHEFQHMIHFYQKTVLRTNGVGTETWIDEMCSLATEDLVANKIFVNGPRGSQYSQASFIADTTDPRNPYVSLGRLAYYNYFNDASVTYWYSKPYVLRSYAINYALGAYLARNYGGVKFFHDVVYNPNTDYIAIEYALQQNGSSDDFGAILQKWAIANLISDKYDTVNAYKYNNNATWFTSNTDPVTVEYSVGSINLYHNQIRFLDGTTQTGPYYYTESNPIPTGTMPQASNQYYRAAYQLNGSRTWDIKLKSTIRLNVLAR